MPLIDIGRRVPDFALKTQDGGVWRLSEQRRVTVLFMYPQDDTPGCTTEACAFRDLTGEFEALDAQVVGLSPDGVESHQRFIAKYGLTMNLLADEVSTKGVPKVIAKLGAWGEKLNYGKTSIGLIRTTYVIAPGRQVLMRFDRVRATGHAERVLESLVESLKNKKK